MEIDLVYLWCDDSDKSWHKKRMYYAKQCNMNTENNCEGRYVQSDELKYSLRSVAKYMPWVHHIYIVSDRQIPKWLNLKNPKISIVKHEDILPKEKLPLFNSSAIETGLANIPHLSEYFLYMNDDFFINKKTELNDFITQEGTPICRMNRHKSTNPLTFYERRVYNMYCQIKKDFNLSEKFCLPHHNIDIYRKTDFFNCQQYYQNLVTETLCHRFRDEADWERALAFYYAIATKKMKLKIENKYRFSFLYWLKHTLLDFGKKDSIVIPLTKKNYLKKLKRYSPKFFCLEDNEQTTNEDRKRGKKFLEQYFPEKSEFE